MSYENITNKFRLERYDHFWKYLQIRNCLKGRVTITHESNPIDKGEFIQHKILNIYYYTPSALCRMGVGREDLCWKCQQVKVLIHTLWKCRLFFFPVWNSVLNYMQGWIPCNLPRSPKLYLLGDKREVPQLNKHQFSKLSTALVAFAHVILEYWKDSHTPTLKMRKERMIGNVACKKMLGRLHHVTETSVKRWDNFYTYISTCLGHSSLMQQTLKTHCFSLFLFFLLL